MLTIRIGVSCPMQSSGTNELFAVWLIFLGFAVIVGKIITVVKYLIALESKFKFRFKLTLKIKN